MADTLTKIMELDPGAADLIATLRASAEGTDRAQKGGWRGVMVAKFAQHGVGDDDRHAFCEAAFGHASSNDLEPHQCRATAYWLDDGGAAQVARVARAFLRARGQLDLPGIPKGAESALERPQSVLGAFGEWDAALLATIEGLGAVVRPIENKEATMSEEQATHWTQDAEAFWAWTVDKHGLAADEVLEALGVDDLAEFAGTKTDALHAINLYAETIQARRSIKALSLVVPERQSNDTATIAWMRMYAPDGSEVSVTAHEGATGDSVAATALALWLGGEILKTLDWIPKAEYRARPATDDQVSPQAPPAQAVAPPPPTRTAPPPPPGGPGQTQSSQPGGNGGGTFQTETVKITAPKGKPVVEFWCSGRQYPEVTWMLGGERMMEVAPSLAEAGWVAEHFDDVGQVYALPLSVAWTPSPKNPKWKDIVAVTLR